jgi:transposase
VEIIKIHQKISGTFCSLHGAAIFCRIRRDISTLKKQGLPVSEYAQTAFQGEP